MHRALLPFLLLAAVPASARDGLYFDFGGNAVVGLASDPARLYPYVGTSVRLSGEPASLVPGVAFELAPDSGRMGLVLSLAVDRSLNDRWGVNLTGALVQDLPDFDGSRSNFFLSFGPGVRLFLDRWVMSCSVRALRGLNVSTWAVALAFGAAYALL